jgi:tetratricopeptide (TPR) repeat protein
MKVASRAGSSFALARTLGTVLLLLFAACIAGCSSVNEYHKQLDVVATLDEADRELTLGNTAQARTWCDRAIALDPSSANTYLGMKQLDGSRMPGVISVLDEHGDYPDMVSYIDNAVAKPALASHWELWAALAEAQQHLGNTPAMQQAAHNELVYLDKQMSVAGSQMDIGTAADMLTSKADAEWLAGDQTDAQADYKKAIETYPDQAEVAENDEAYFESLAKINLPLALKLAKEAVGSAERNDEPDENVGLFTDTLGWVEHQMGDNNGAVNDLEQAASLAPDEGDIAFHLASVYQALGRKSDAVIEYQRVLQLEPYDSDAERELVALSKPTPPANPPAPAVSSKSTPA